MKYLVKQACRIESDGRDHYFKLDQEVEIPATIERTPSFPAYVSAGWLVPLEYRVGPPSLQPKTPVANKPKHKPVKKIAKPASAEVPNPEVVG